MQIIFVTKRICASFLCRERGLCIFFRENDLGTSSGKFLHVESCHPESSDFLGLWLSGGSIYVERANIVPAALEVRPAENKPWMKTLNRDWCGTEPWWQLFSLGIKGNIRERPWRVFSFAVLLKGKHLGRVIDLETTRSYQQKLIDFEKPNYSFVVASIDRGRSKKRF